MRTITEEACEHMVVAHMVAAAMSYSGDALLVGSNAYNLIEQLEMHGDLDFVTTNRQLVQRLPHKTLPGIAGDIHVATLSVGSISVDISTCDGHNFAEDRANRSYAACSGVYFLTDTPGYKIAYHGGVRRIIPDSEDAQAWVRRMIRLKGSRVTGFWQQKLSKGFVWGQTLDYSSDSLVSQ
tara:strand:+ start:7051 stop:7593 length:543 start_codon:yes stop_codon:yes gene_type:complete